jgi:hypothetical protein
MKKPTKKTSPKTSQLTKESYWNEVDQQSHCLVAKILNSVLPLPNLDLKRDKDYQELLFAYETNYKSEAENKVLAEQITYDYLLLVVKSLLSSLSSFDCHLGFEELFE